GGISSSAATSPAMWNRRLKSCTGSSARRRANSRSGAAALESRSPLARPSPREEGEENHHSSCKFLSPWERVRNAKLAAAGQRQPFLFRQDRDAELFRLLELAARILPGDDEIRLFRDRPGHFRAKAFRLRL